MQKPGTENVGMILVGVLVVVCLPLAGCGDDDPAVPSPDVPPVTASPQALLQHFVTAYEERDADLYATLLHPAFASVIHPGTLAEWAGAEAPLVGPTFSRAEEIAIHANIFAGASGAGPAGETVSPVTAIQFEVMEQYASWADISADNEHFGGHGGVFAPFRVRLSFDHADNHRTEVREDIGVYAAPIEVEGRQSWLLLGLWGAVYEGKAVENLTLCGIKAIYRNH